MATKQAGKDAMAFIVSALKRNKDVAYADVRKRAEEKGFAIYPIMFGRAKALLDYVKVAKRGETQQGRGAKEAKLAKAPGRKRGRPEETSSKSGQIRALLRTGMTPAEIAKQVGCSVNLVYNVRSAGKGSTSGRTTKAPRRKAGSGRMGRRSTADLRGSTDSVVETLCAGDRERTQLLKALEQIRAIVEDIG